LNCAAIPEGLIEAELFGVAKGAYTSAVASRPGRFELAHGGTLFLDEISMLSPLAQSKVLRAIQEGEFERVGDIRTTKVDVRLLAA
ncbi:sigma 54-interacting transcriptional regulator, partial [Klebsiella pneumoniae]|uniref:sigma 54-interacting transcriptional regulator n=1 Tax=Klebsiella pneumoniae TaxID=573 RepID=UPI003854F85B